MKKALLAVALGAGTLLGTDATLAIAQTPDKAQSRAPGGGMTKADNDDGVLTRDEAMARADVRFAALDANRDGKATPDEVKAEREARRASRPARLPRAGMDPNRDSIATREEFRTRAAQMFDRVDANRDGKIDASERQAIRGEMRLHRGHNASAPDGDAG